MNLLIKEWKKSKTKQAIEDIKTLYEQRQKVIKLFDNFSRILSKGKYKSKHGIGLKILIPKQMLQRLPRPLAQVKASNTSENLLNEIRKIIYSLYRKLLRKSYKNNKFKISVPTWNKEFELPGGSYYISDIQDYFEYVLKRHV